jgi:hypothetical protein
MDIPGISCATNRCNCECGDDAVSYDAMVYCSQRCADGRGCDHLDCNCGAFPTAEPQPDSDQGSR